MSCGKLLYSQSEVQISAWSCDGCLSEVEGGFMGLASLVVQLVKNPLANAEDMRCGLDPRVRKLSSSIASSRSNPLQYSSLENHMDIGAWYATVHRVAKSWI